jgi:hypothetical protein
VPSRPCRVSPGGGSPERVLPVVGRDGRHQSSVARAVDQPPAAPVSLGPAGRVGRRPPHP